MLPPMRRLASFGWFSLVLAGQLGCGADSGAKSGTTPEVGGGGAAVGGGVASMAGAAGSMTATGGQASGGAGGSADSLGGGTTGGASGSAGSGGGPCVTTPPMMPSGATIDVTPPM